MGKFEYILFLVTQMIFRELKGPVCRIQDTGRDEIFHGMFPVVYNYLKLRAMVFCYVKYVGSVKKTGQR